MNWREVTSLFHLLYVFSPCCVNHVPCSVISAAGSIVMSYQFCWWFRWWRTCLQWRRLEYNPWVRKIPWRRARQLTPVFLPGESHGQRSHAGFSPWGHKESDRTRQLNNKVDIDKIILTSLSTLTCSLMSSRFTVLNTRKMSTFQMEFKRFHCVKKITSSV